MALALAALALCARGKVLFASSSFAGLSIPPLLLGAAGTPAHELSAPQAQALQPLHIEY